MKAILITTTIYVPEVLRVYRKFAPEVLFIIAGDKKTPHKEVRNLANELGNTLYLSDEEQEKLGYQSSAVIGWNKIMRRNIALLEAIKQKPDFIISIDDDNIPLENHYFEHFYKIFGTPFTGLMISSPNKWINVGEFLEPPVYHRGFPFDKRSFMKNFHFKPVFDKKIGVAAGLWLGDPDIDAMDRIVNKPLVLNVSEVLRGGFIVDNTNFTPFNSQNTAYRFELAPLMMVLVGVGRYDDIWASYIAERVLMETDYYVHFGQPFVWQERNPQNLWKNLKDELLGMEYTTQFCNDLLDIDIGEGSIIDKLYRIYSQLKTKSYIPPIVFELGEAWCRDLEKILC